MLGVKPPSVNLGHGTVLLQFRVFSVLKVRKTVPLRTSRGIVNCVIWAKSVEWTAWEWSQTIMKHPGRVKCVGCSGRHGYLPPPPCRFVAALSDASTPSSARVRTSQTTRFAGVAARGRGRDYRVTATCLQCTGKSVSLYSRSS